MANHVARSVEKQLEAEAEAYGKPVRSPIDLEELQSDPRMLIQGLDKLSHEFDVALNKNPDAYPDRRNIAEPARRGVPVTRVEA